MMHYRSHRGRWWFNPLGQAKAPTLWERIWGWLNEMFSPLTMLEGRRRIDPAEPYGSWANGWSKATAPNPALGKMLAKAEMEENA